MKTIASIEARMGSNRLPGKVLIPLQNKTVLEHIISRLRHCHYLSGIIVATTENKADDRIAELCSQLQISCYRGSEDDVLDRLVGAHRQMASDTVVEITGDSPLVDPDIVDRAIQCYREYGVDYLSNTLERSFPIGMRVQVFSRQTLEKAAALATRLEDREHVTTYICRHPETFNLRNMIARPEEHWPDLRLTLDYPEDLDVIRTIYDALYQDDTPFHLSDIIGFMKAHPQIAGLNQHCIHTAQYT